MNPLRGFFGGFADGKPGAFSQLDGSNPLERLLMGLTGTPAPAQAGVPMIPQASASPVAVPGSIPGGGDPGVAPAQVQGVPQTAPRQHRKANFFDYIVDGPNAGRMIEDEEQVKDWLGKDPEALAIYQAAGPSGLTSYLNDKRGRSKPTLYSTKRGIVSVAPKDGGGYSTETVFDIPPDAPEASPGWIANPDGTWSPVKNGPYDPKYIAETAGVRRDAVVSRPIPSHAKPASASANTIKWD